MLGLVALSHIVGGAAVMSHSELQRELLGSLWRVGPGLGVRGRRSCPSGTNWSGSLFTGGRRKASETGLCWGVGAGLPSTRGASCSPGSCAQTPVATLGVTAPSCGVTVGPAWAASCRMELLVL